jgi:predicted RNA-binding protein with PIN domain
MPYLIDGHNLIPKLPGISLEEVNDEQRLIEMLQEFCRVNRKQLDVYFDNAPPGNMAVRKHGAVTAHFIRQGHTADAAIRARLTRLGNAARNWIVVSSDQGVQNSARAARARFLSSEAFARDLLVVNDVTAPETGKRAEAQLSAAEVDEWLRLFERKDD